MKLPQQLLNSLKDLKGFDEEAFIEVHNKEEKITSIRLNPFKPCVLDFETREKVKWCDAGFYLSERPSFTFDPLFHAGCYYVQEAGSMFLQHALKNSVDLKKDLTVLDLCAAPGGKSTLINSIISENSVLVSNEVIKPRAEILSQNISKWGTCNVAVTNNDPEVFSNLEEVFDVIIADVPCSGSGLFRKQTSAVEEWSVGNVNLCSTRQKRILGDVLNSLKSDGTLIYSTCSYSEEENEAIVKWLIKDFEMERVNIPIEEKWGILDTKFGYRFYPYLTQSEGFFCAVLRKKKSGEDSHKRKPKKNSLEKVSDKEMKLLSGFLIPNKNNHIIKFMNEFKLMSTALLEFWLQYGSGLYFKNCGTTIGEIKHDDFIPNHEFAQSIYLNDKINRTELNRNEAISFLKKENLYVKAEKGICLMTYKNFALGWAKVLDNRINNYLPKDYRIISSEE